MSVLLFEGPEKAGKSTVIAALAEHLHKHLKLKVVVRHQIGRAKPDDRVYADQLAVDTAADKYVAIWDRCYPSEYVYGTMLGQDRRLALDPWLGEWLYGRAIRANGAQFMVTGPAPSILAKSRTDDDLPVDPAEEQALYLAYALRFGWHVIRRAPVSDQVERIMKRIPAAIIYGRGRSESPLPPVYAGTPNARVVVVGEMRSERMLPGGWLPFSSHLTTKLGRLMGDRAMGVGWTNAHDCPPETLRSAEVIVTCGAKARLWVEHYVLMEGGEQQVIPLAHPAHAFRYNNPVANAEKRVVKSRVVKLTRSIEQ